MKVGSSIPEDVSNFRSTVSEWAGRNWRSEQSVEDWWRVAYEAGWQFPSWPTGLGGRSTTADEARAVQEVFSDLRILGPPFGVAQTHGAPLVLAHGSDEQKRR